MADTYSLDLVANVRYRRGFRYKVAGEGWPLTGYSWRAQVRRKEAPDAALLVDLSPYLALDGADETLLWLNIPGSITGDIGEAKMPETANWDLFVWPTDNEDDAILLVQGPVTLDRSATDMG